MATPFNLLTHNRRPLHAIDANRDVKPRENTYVIWTYAKN